MDRKKYRTIEAYEDADARMCIVKQLGELLLADIGGVVSDKDYNTVQKALKKIDEVCVYAKENMFADFPDLDEKYNRLFCCSKVTDKPCNEVDVEQIALAKDMVVYFF